MDKTVSVRKALALVGLLHDVGKFYQRADTKKSFLSPETLKMEDQLCPSVKGGYRSHKHALWTWQFLQDYLQHSPFPIDRKLSEIPTDTIQHLAASHHSPSSLLEFIIQQADWMSSGIDRSRAEEQTESKSTDVRRHKLVRLRNIFSYLELLHKNGSKAMYHELESFQPYNDRVFPTKVEKLIPENGSDLTEQYENLWKGFTKRLAILEQSNEDIFLANIQSALEEFTCCIPSITTEGYEPDVSLYDHARTTAAIATALYGYHFDKETLVKSAILNRDEHKFILVGGDLSGIQNYIFGLKKTAIKGVAKILRARSFYVQLVCNSAAHLILTETGYPLVSTIMDAGGRFTLILPNSDQVKNQLRELNIRINQWFSDIFYGELSLNLDYSIMVSPDDFFEGAFQRVFFKHLDALEAAKTRKFHSVFVEKGGWEHNHGVISKYYDQYEEVCQCCGKLPGTEKVIIDDEADKSVSYCRLCANQLNIGKALTKPARFVYSYGTPITRSDSVIALFDDKIYLNIVDKHDTGNLKDAYLIEQYWESNVVDSPVCLRYLAHHVPKHKSGSTKTFEDLAEADIFSIDGESFGMNMLGVLKADVDRMGLLFSKGFGKVTIARYATLSRMLNVFFGGYVQALLEKEYPDVYTVFCGGDDLFLIGPWETMIEFSIRLQKDFEKWTSENPDITISAGLIFSRHNYPVHRAAEMAGEALEKSKEFRNRFTVFNTTLEWKDFPELRKFKDFLNEKFQDKHSKVKSAFLYRLLNYHQMYLRSTITGDCTGAKNDPTGLRFHALMTYDIDRNIKRVEGQKIINADELQQLERLHRIAGPDKVLLDNLRVPVWWTLYRNRKYSDSKTKRR